MSDGLKAYWSHTLRIGTHSIYAWERLERGGLIHVKFSSPERRGRDRRVKQKLPGDLAIRDGKGRVDKKLVTTVLRAVEEFAAPLLKGAAPVSPDDVAKSLTISEGFDLALDVAKGKYPTKSLRWQEVNRARAKLERILTGNRAWIEMTPGDVRGIWRTLAVEYKSASQGTTVCGARQAEVTVDALYSVASWLRDEGKLPQTALIPTKKWRSQLQSEWEKLTGAVVRPSRPRHDEAELHRLFKHMHHPSIDPRFALAFDLGGEQRLGQVLRARRSDLNLSVVNSNFTSEQVGELGSIRIHGNPRKPASVVMFTADQRRAVEGALDGYLGDYESAFLRGELDDYLLFPAGRTKKGKARICLNARALTRDAALGMFHELERIAGVDPVKGRGWYGIRRKATDLSEDIEPDERVLNSITGHRDSTTRRLVYQEGTRPEVLIKAARTRARVRSGDGVPIEASATLKAERTA